MDWNSFKEKAVKFKDSAVTKSKPYLEKAADKSKPYLEKAAQWGYENVQKIPMVMKNGEDFEKVRLEKNLVIFVLEKDEDFSKKVMREFPLMLSRAWIASATTRIIQKEESPELLALLDDPACPAVLIYKKGVLSRKIEAREELDAFIKNFNVSDSGIPPSEDSPIDMAIAQESGALADASTKNTDALVDIPNTPAKPEEIKKKAPVKKTAIKKETEGKPVKKTVAKAKTKKSSIDPLSTL